MKAETARNLTVLGTFAYVKYATIKAESAAKMARPVDMARAA